MIKIPFHKIAITPSIEKEGELLRWAETAFQKGADALMLRQIPAKIIADTFQELLQLKLPLLNNHSGFYEAEWSGFQLKENEPYFVFKNKFIGRSCHSINAVQMAESENCNYVFLSPIFNTRSHPEQPCLGVDYLKRATAITQIPIFALGGIETEKQVEDCLLSGTYGFAAITYFL